ncbi:MAG TPA: hypothetical protein VGC21_00590 [Telluria sp.]|jgi:hypothetical protein
MFPSIRKLGLICAVVASACAASCLAADNSVTEAAQPVPVAVTPAALPVAQRFDSRGPAPIIVSFFNINEEKVDTLRLVTRTHVVGANIAFAAIGAVLGANGVPTTVQFGEKKEFYGDEITDASSASRLRSPFRVALPAALDQQIMALAEAESVEAGPVSLKKTLRIEPREWHLVYNELNADKENEDAYVLRFAAYFSKEVEGEESAFLRKARSIGRSCLYVSKPQPLAAWKQNDYDAIQAEGKRALESCIDQLTPSLPAFLGFDSNSKIRIAQLNCKTNLKQCVAEADTAAEPDETKKLCKTEYKQCISTDVKPMIDMTPLGQCKVTLAACKASVIDKARVANPDEKAPRSAFVPCSLEYKACVQATK